MRAVLKKWGKSTALRIPTHVLRKAGLRENQVVQVEVAGGKIVISRPDRAVSYDLSELLAGMTNTNKHAAVEVRPLGNELL